MTTPDKGLGPCATCGRAHVQGVWWPRHPYVARVRVDPGPYQQRIEVSFVIPIANHDDPDAEAERVRAEVTRSFPDATRVSVEGQWRGKVVRK